jgi:hypothetical protein
MTKYNNQKEEHKRSKTPKEPHTGGRGEKNHRTVSA